MQQCLVASCQTHHGFIDGTVTVGIQPHGLPYNVCRFGQPAGEQSHFIHGVQQFPVRRLETVDLRQCTGNDDAHGVGHIVFFQCICNFFFFHNAGTGNIGIGNCIFLWFFRLLFSCHFCPRFYEMSASSRYSLPYSAMKSFRPCRSSPSRMSNIFAVSSMPAAVT